MSSWTYLNGTVTVSPMGRTQAEKRYILETVLDHLPKVTGSEEDMQVYIIQKNGHNSSSSHTEFGLWGGHLNWDKKNLSLQTQAKYILVVNGSFRDRYFDQTYREFQKWLCRLAKRVMVEDVLVEVKSYGKKVLIRDDTYGKYYKMFESPSWCRSRKEEKEENREPNWCEYLMWDRAKGSDLPALLEYKYYNNPDNDVEVERRLRYGNRN